MNSTALPVTVFERLAWIMNALLIAVARPARSPLLAGWLMPVYGRILRVRNRVNRLIRQIEAGTVRPLRGGGQTATRREMDEATRRGLAERLRASAKMPRRRGWLLPLAHYDLLGHASQLTHLLQDEEMQRRLAATPLLARTLRPLCRMLGIDPALLGEAATGRRQRRTAPGATEPGSAEPGSAARGATTPVRRKRRSASREPSAAEVMAEINRRRWPSIEQQARPDRYRWTPLDDAGAEEAGGRSG